MGTYLGQNFLIDSKIRHWIADKAFELYQHLSTEAIVEIGPGKGSITSLIKDISPNFVVIEKDEKMIPFLSELITPMQIINGDVLLLEDFTLKFATEPTCLIGCLVVGNLPYYITSPILRKFFTCDSNCGFSSAKLEIVAGLFMIQKEVGEKIDFNSRKKSYLYWLLNYGYEVRYLKTVSAKAFNPPPKVQSCLISLEKREVKPDFSFSSMIEFLDLFVSFPRKTLGSIAKKLDSKRNMQRKRYEIPENLQKKRLEELTWDDLAVILKT